MREITELTSVLAAVFCLVSSPVLTYLQTTLPSSQTHCWWQQNAVTGHWMSRQERTFFPLLVSICVFHFRSSKPVSAPSSTIHTNGITGRTQKVSLFYFSTSYVNGVRSIYRYFNIFTGSSSTYTKHWSRQSLDLTWLLDRLTLWTVWGWHF